MALTTTDTCPDCGVAPGNEHGEHCDVARCLDTGEQRLIHEMYGETNCCGRDVWTGEWPA